MFGIIGRKIGMSSFYDDTGSAIPITIIKAGPCDIVQIKDIDKDGYSAIQLGFEDQKEHRVSSPSLGHFKSANIQAKKVLREFKVDSTKENKIGDKVDVSIFNDVLFVDVVSTGKGRGFQGVVKRYDFGGGRASHGGGWLRRPGSIGMCTSPARVFKGKKMPGHMGNKRVTTQSLKVVSVRHEENLIFVKGSIPGANGSILLINKALKKK